MIEATVRREAHTLRPLRAPRRADDGPRRAARRGALPVGAPMTPDPVFTPLLPGQFRRHAAFSSSRCLFFSSSSTGSSRAPMHDRKASQQGRLMSL